MYLFPQGKWINFQVKQLLHGNICLPSYLWLLRIRIVPVALSFKRFQTLGNKLTFLLSCFPFLNGMKREREGEKSILFTNSLIYTNAHPNVNGMGMSIHVSMCVGMEYDQNYFCCCFNVFYTFSGYVCGQRYVPLRLHPCAAYAVHICHKTPFLI